MTEVASALDTLFAAWEMPIKLAANDYAHGDTRGYAFTGRLRGHWEGDLYKLGHDDHLGALENLLMSGEVGLSDPEHRLFRSDVDRYKRLYTQALLAADEKTRGRRIPDTPHLPKAQLGGTTRLSRTSLLRATGGFFQSNNARIERQFRTAVTELRSLILQRRKLIEIARKQNDPSIFFDRFARMKVYLASHFSYFAGKYPGWSAALPVAALALSAALLYNYNQQRGDPYAPTIG